MWETENCTSTTTLLYEQIIDSDDYLFTSFCFWEHWFPLENRFFEFSGASWYKKAPVFSLFIFHRDPPLRRITDLLALPWKISTLFAYFSLLIFQSLFSQEKNQSGEGRYWHHMSRFHLITWYRCDHLMGEVMWFNLFPWWAYSIVPPSIMVGPDQIITAD
jgi:hypothetical protein